VTGLQADVEIARGAFRLAATMDAEPGRITAILGPNGAGKSTLVRAIAGLDALDAGRISIDGSVVDDPAADVFVPPERRRVGVVFQDYLLFEHMSVRDNVEFGPRSRRDPDAAARAQEWMERLGIEPLAARSVRDLSGGQAQRVAMARALATDPAVLLLDEPLSALDATTRTQVRRELRSHLSGFGGTTLLVTHEPLDALVLADDVVILEGGSVTQRGSTEQVAARPATPYVAALMGANLLHATAADGVATTGDGVAVAIADHQLTGEVVVVMRPEAISLHRAHPEGSPRNVWQVRVRELEPRLDRVLVHVTGPPDLAVAVTPSAISDLEVVPGAPMWASVKALDIDAYARTS
jgi:molybdate transport system ATP-binding protein